ncbi:MAG: DUF58 domain-containing protein [Pseudomonadota bacterium]
MAPIGTITNPSDRLDALGRSRDRAALIPELVVEAGKIANTVISGWHGRKKRGIGENFWQYRPYAEGETLARIDWRRSARGDETFVRDLEWEAAHTVWIWCDQSPSMLYKSKNARISKEHRAMVLAFSMAELLSRAGERVGYPGLLKPVMSRHGAERLAGALSASNAADISGAKRPALESIQRFSDLVVISDFLDPVSETEELIDAIAARGTRAHFIEVIDPAEEVFPYSGRVEFTDPETGQKLTAGKAQEWTDDYRNMMVARREMLASHCRRLGWSFSVSHTDVAATDALLNTYAHMSGNVADDTRRG